MNRLFRSNRLIAGIISIGMTLMLSVQEAFPQSVQRGLDSTEYYVRWQQWEKAQKVAEQTINLVRQQYVPTHPLYAQSLLTLAQVFFQQQQFEPAIPYYELALPVWIDQWGKDHYSVATVRSEMAYAYQETKNYRKAYELYSLAIPVLRGRVRLAYFADILNNFILVAIQLGNYEQALPFGQEALSIRRQNAKSETDPDYLTSMNNLASLYDYLGKYEQALTLQRRAVELAGQLTNKRGVSYGIFLNKLGKIYRDQGNFKAAQQTYEQSLSAHRYEVEERSPQYANVLALLGDLYTAMGRYELALPFLKEAVNFPEDSVDYATSIHNLASLYLRMGQLDYAQPLFEQSLGIRGRRLGPDHLDYAQSLNNIAALLRIKKQFKASLPLQQQVVQIWKRTYGPTHPNYALGVGNLAGIYRALGQDSLALVYYQQVLKIFEENQRTSHPDYATTLAHMASIWFNRGDSSQAIILQKKAISILETELGDEHPSTITNRENLAHFYANTGQGNLALVSLEKGLRSAWQRLALVSSGYSESDRRLAVQDVEKALYGVSSLRYRLGNTLSDSTTFYYHLQLKELLLDQTRHLKRRLEVSSDSVTRQQFTNWQILKTQIAHYHSLPRDQQVGLPQLNEQADALERLLVKESNAFRQFQQRQRITFGAIRESLAKDEAAVEFIRFYYYNGSWTDSTFYGAYVIRPGWQKPAFVFLGDERTFQQFIKSQQQDANALYLPNSKAANLLYRLLWKPLEPFLKAVNVVHYAPTGLLHQLSFSAIIGSDGKRLTDRYSEFRRVSSTVLLVADKEKPVRLTTPYSAVLIGDVTYETNPPPRPKLKSTEKKAPPKVIASVDTIPSLPGTGGEVQKIATILSAGTPISVLKRATATETRVKNLSGKSPTILHIATHGFYFQEAPSQSIQDFFSREAPYFKTSDNPLMRSGLLLAGSGNVWRNELRADIDKDDGVLTAYELADLNLNKTTLTVLSACESGLGKLQDAEGVYGLQRALRLAGVHSLIISLWRVPDNDTAFLMTEFYKNWKAGATLSKAFRKAQSQLRASTSNPSHWAGFVLID